MIVRIALATMALALIALGAEAFAEASPSLTYDPYYQYQYEFVPAPAPEPEPLPPWFGTALLAVLGGLAALFILLVMLSSRGNIAVSRANRDDVKGVKIVDLDRVVRLRESLRVVRAYFGQTLLSTGSLIYVLLLLSGIGLLLYALSQGTALPSPLVILLVFAGLNLAALIALFILSAFQYIHRRVVGFFQVIMTPFVILMNIIGIGFATGPFAAGVEALMGTHSETMPGIVLLVMSGLMIASFVMVFGWARNCWRLMMARRDNFLVARGWRSPNYSLGGAVRRMIGVPTYVSALRTGRRRVMALFVLAGALGAGAALFPIAAPGLIANFLAMGMDQSGYIDTQLAMTGVIGTPIAIVVIFLFFQLLAFFGRLASRAGQRMAANRYQSVREWDDRAPILFLRSFAIDNRPVATKPRGWTARLIGLGASLPTLDEAVLDCAAPYGPLIAVGDPRDPVPPLGAARTFVGGGDWKQVVSDLARASRLIVLAVDSSEGVRWEVQHIIRSGHAAKTLFLASPERTPQERAAALGEVARGLGYSATLPEQAIAVSSAPAGVEVMTAPNVSGDSYAAALNLRLQQDFGLSVKFPRRPRGAASTAHVSAPSASQPQASSAPAVGAVVAIALIVGAGFLLRPLGQQFANRDMGEFRGSVSCRLDGGASYYSDMDAVDINFTASGRLCVNGRTLYERTGSRYQRAIFLSRARVIDLLTIDPASGRFTRERYPLSDQAFETARATPDDTGLACEAPADAVRRRNASLMRLARGEPAQRLVWRCARHPSP